MGRASSPHTAAVVMVKPTRREVVRILELPGTVRADLAVTLYAKATGFLKEITKDRGDRVKKDELIAVLEIPEMLAEIAHARASYMLEDTTFKRLESIRKVEKSAVTDQDLDIARAKRDMAQAKLKKLETLESYTEIRAPFDGAVTERFVDPGAFIEEGKIVSIVNTEKVRVLVDVPEAEVRAAAVGTLAEIQFDALPGSDDKAVISRSAESLDSTLRTMRVEIDVPNAKGMIYPGMFARVKLAVDRHSMAMVIPSTAVVLRQNHAFVYVDSDGKAKKVSVSLGIEDGPWREILGGLKDDASVILARGVQVVDGMPVRRAVAQVDPPTRTTEEAQK